MKKADLIAKVQGKIGFKSIILDELAPDHIQGDTVEKRRLYVNHVNADGTMGKKFVYYLLDTANGDAGFYNIEEELDFKEEDIETKKVRAMEKYLGNTFFSYFVIRFDTNQFVLEADVFIDGATGLTTKKVIVYKDKAGDKTIKHKEVILG